MTVSWQEGKFNTHILSVSGRLDHEQTPILEKELAQLIQNKQIHLIIDMAHTSYINSGGLRVLVTGWRQVKQAGGRLVLSGLTPRIKDTFHMVGFDKVFNILETQEQAQQLFMPPD